MEIYNTKISYYKNHMQVKVYDNSVKKGEKKIKSLVRTSELIQKENSDKEEFLKKCYADDSEKAKEEIEKLRQKKRSISSYSSTQQRKLFLNISCQINGNSFVLLLLTLL